MAITESSQASKRDTELYSRRRKAEFLLSNAIDETDYLRAREEVKRLGIDPDSVQHERP